MAACAFCQQRKRLLDTDCSDSDRRKATRGDSLPQDASHSLAFLNELPALNTAVIEKSRAHCDGPPQQQKEEGVEPEIEAPRTPELRSSPSPSVSEQQSAHLLLKACEREEAAEERAEQAEQELRDAKSKQRAAEARAVNAEEQLSAAQERIKLLELQVLDRCSGRLSDAKASEAASRGDSEVEAMAEGSSGRSSSEAGGRPAGSFDWEAADPGSEVVQLRLDLEDTHARLRLSRQSEIEACAFAEASTRRLDAFAEMVRGAAAVAFAGNDTSSRRMRHHLFRCLDSDCDGFLGVDDLRYWYNISEHFLDTQGYDQVSFEALRQQLADALHQPDLPPEFACKGKVSLMQLSRSKMGAGIVATLLNLNNMMQDRSTSEWGSVRNISLN